MLCDPNSTAYTGTCCSQVSSVFATFHARNNADLNRSTAGAETHLLTALRAANLDVATMLLHLSPLLLHLRPQLYPRRGTTVDAERTSAVHHVTPVVLTEVAAPLTGTYRESIYGADANPPPATAAAPTATAWSPTVAKMDARTRLRPRPALKTPPRSSADLRRPLRLANQCLVCPPQWPTHPQPLPVSRLPMEAAEPTSEAPSAAIGLRAAAAACTGTVVTPLLIVVKVARTVLVTRLPVYLLLQPALPLPPLSPDPLRWPVDLVSLLCMLV
jgi:hypothetical protein